jgi:iron complex outermembrane recepter protein
MVRTIGARLRHSLLVSTSFIAVASAPVLAQQTPPPAPPMPAAADDGLETIVITAQRQAQSLQDVPIAVSAITGETLEKSGAKGVKDLQFSLPNVTFTKTNFTTASFQIRGVGANAVGASTEESTALHVNDMSIIGARIFETEFYDIERVEVLRGPQGTQFGRNATGGVVNVITRKPVQETEGNVELEVGNYTSFKAKGGFNIPLSDTAAFRIAGLFLTRDGYTKNLATGNRIDGRKQFSLRGSLRWKPTDDTTIDFMASTFHENDDRARIQKQLCHRDVTGVYGCLPDKLAFETTNANSTFPATLGSVQFLRVALGALGGLAPLVALSDLTKPDQFAGVVNPADYRTVNLSTEPKYKSHEDVFQFSAKHDFDKASIKFNAGYTRNGVASTNDYYLAVANPFTLPAAIANPNIFLGVPGLSPAQAAGLVGAFTQIKARLFQGNNLAVSALDTPYGYTGAGGGNIAGYFPSIQSYDLSQSKAKQYTLEGIVTSKLDGPVNALLGVIYGKYRTGPLDYNLANSQLDYDAAILGLSTGQTLASPYFNSETNNYTLKSKAIFGEVYYQFTDTLKLTAGARYLKDTKFVRDRSVLLNAPIPFGSSSFLPTITALTSGAGVRNADGSCVFDADSTTPGRASNATVVGTCNAYRESTIGFKRLTGRAVLSWQPELSFTDDTLVYASFSRGFKSGGQNPPFDATLFPGQTPTYKPETINAYEIGTKNRFADGRAQINLTGFYYGYKDLQVSSIISRTSFNASVPAKIYGIEAEFQYKPTPDLLLSANASYLKTKIGNGVAILDPSNVTAGRTDVLVVKDLQTASQCVVTPTAGGLPVATALRTVGAALTVIGTNPAFTPAIGAATQASLAQAGGGSTAVGATAFQVPGANTLGNFGLCAALRGAAGAVANPALAPLFAAIGGLPAGARFTVNDGIPTDLSGHQLQNSPKFHISVAADYTYPLENDMSLNGRVDYAYHGSTFGRIYNLASDRLKGYGILNARLSYRGPERKWAINGFVENVTNTKAVTGLYVTDQSTGLFRNVYTVEPRRFGLSGEYHF